MVKSRKLALVLLVVAAACAMNCMSVLAAPADTGAKGYRMIEGNVCDLSGNLLIKMYDGFTADGYTLDPDFQVQYPSAGGVAVGGAAHSLKKSDVFFGTRPLLLNAAGGQERALGADFRTELDAVVLRYIAGDPRGVNFSVFNVTRNSLVRYLPNVSAQSDVGFMVSAGGLSRNDVYRVTASAEGSAGAGGNAYLNVLLRKAF